MSSEGEYQHGKPAEGMCCMCTYEDITEEAQNYVEFQSYPSEKWKPCLFEACIVDQMLETQFEQYVDRVKKTDCQAELRRLLKSGPPVHIADKHGLALAEEGDTHVSQLWFARDPTTTAVSSKLKGAPEGPERQKLWDELQKFIIVEGKEEGDDDDMDKDDQS